MTIEETFALLSTTIEEQQKKIESLVLKIEDLQKKAGSIPPHLHNNIDGSPQLEPQDALEGFPISYSVPTDPAPEGTLRLYSSGGTYKLYIRINKGWRTVTLT